jgi:hypothetical protein
VIVVGERIAGRHEGAHGRDSGCSYCRALEEGAAAGQMLGLFAHSVLSSLVELGLQGL